MYRLKSFWFENYRAYRQLTRIELKPLTLVFGKNSSGKSALVRFPTMLLESLTHEVPGFRLQGEQLRYASTFHELVHGQGPGIIRAGIEGSPAGQPPAWSLEAQLGPGRNSDPLAQRLYTWRFKPGNRGMETFIQEDGETGRYSVSGPRPHKNEPECTFAGFTPSLQRGRQLFPWQVEPLRSAHLGPFRPGGAQTSWERAQHLPQWSAESWAHRLLLSEETDKKLLHMVDGWLKNSLGWRLEVRKHFSSIAAPERFSVLLRRDNDLLWQNLAYLGTGMQQVLPVLVQAAALATGELNASLVVCEEPESHLHPAAHAALADLYLDAARSNLAPLLIETHSEVLLLRVRRRVAEGADPASVGLIYVDDQGSSIVARSLELDQDGWVKDWPLGVFEEDSAERRALGRALAREPRA